MSNVINFPKSGVSATKWFCECGHALEYWVGDDGNGYGICPPCNLGQPTEINILEGDEEE